MLLSFKTAAGKQTTLGPITVGFEDAASGRRSREFGPFMHFSSLDGMTYLNHELFCQFNAAAGLWYVHSERSEWPSVLVKKA